ncbi:MAG: hypothetical protein ACYDC8_15435 [Gammaproteobacteria bacterium]
MAHYTSYSSVKTLANLLAPQLRTALVVADPDVRVDRQADRFIALSRRGIRPLWLAVGSAWTGLDVGGHHPPYTRAGVEELPADEDNVLTDIVVPRLPFGVNRSITHQRRLQTKPGIPWEVLDVALRTKQVIGRLVRRPGLPVNRRIFVLDGRLNDPEFIGQLSLIRGVFKPYTANVLAKSPGKK